MKPFFCCLRKAAKVGGWYAAPKFVCNRPIDIQQHMQDIVVMLMISNGYTTAVRHFSLFQRNNILVFLILKYAETTGNEVYFKIQK